MSVEPLDPVITLSRSHMTFEYLHTQICFDADPFMLVIQAKYQELIQAICG